MGHTKAMWAAIFSLATAAAPCAELGERALLRDFDGLEKASAGVTASSPPCERYLRALALAQLPVPTEEAKRLWLSLKNAPEAIADWAKLESARHAWTAKDLSLALPGETSAGFPQRFELDVIRLVSGDLTGVWKKVVAEPAGERRRVQLEWLAEAGVEEAKRELFVEYPDSKQAPLAYPTATLKDLVRRAGVANDKHMNADVLKTVAAARAMQPGDVDQCALAFYEGSAQRKLRKYALAETALLAAMDACKKDPRDFKKRAHYLLGQVQIIARPLATASATLNKFAAEYKNDTLTDDALFGIAVATNKAGERGEAQRLYERVAAMNPPGDMCAEAAFRSAYASYQAEKWKEAADKFAKLAAGSCGADDYERARGAYWHARALDRSGAPGEPKLKELAASQPLAFYGLLARARLGAAAPPYKLAEPEAPATLPVSSAMLRADGLSAVGLYREAQVELLALTPEAGDEAQLSYAAALARAKQYHKSSWVFRTSLRHALSAAPQRRADVAWSIAYPRPFEREVASAEKRERLEDDFLLSLIREESAFQLDAGSWANAFGLTQLLVETAQMTARDAKRKDVPTAEMLREDPVLSIDLGAHHLAMLQRKYRHPALILAAYNAGLGNVTKWVDARGEKPFDEFLEEIPFDETRGYVKRILRTWSIYRMLSGKPLPKIELQVANK